MAHILFDIARKLNLYFRISRNGSKVFTFVNTDETPYSLSGTDFKLRIKSYKGASDNVIELTTSSGLSVADNVLTVSITDTQSAIAEKMYYWELYDATGKKTWLFGNAYFTAGYPTEETETTSITINLDPDTVVIEVSGDGGGGAATWGSITGTLSSQTDLQTALDAKQSTLVSGTNIKTINGSSILGSGDLTVSGGGGGTWGSITGTLSNQTDLQTALDARLSKTGGTMSGAIAMGTYKITGLGAATANGDAVRYEQVIAIPATALVDGATIDLTAAKHTLASSSATRTFTISYTGDDITLEVTLSNTAATYTFPAAALCVSEGTASGDNTLSLAGVSGDKYIITIKKIGSAYYVVSKNFGQ